MSDLNTTARALVAPGKGILAADESSGTIQKRFDSIDVESTEASRRDYREMLFRTPRMSDHISGVILYDETLRQKAADGTPLVDLLTGRGVIPGIKVDGGLKPLAGGPGEVVTEGLDGLRGRLEEYRGLGARFAKWRAVITIGDGLPTRRCILANAHALARYAALSQEAGLVPIVEPEVLMEGDHTIERCEAVSEVAFHETFHALHEHAVVLEDILLKPSMVVSGSTCPTQAGVEQVAEATLRCLRRTVPAAVPGIVFLSGGQTYALATAHLNAMNAMSDPAFPHPWRLSFSYGRALQETVLKAWQGAAANVAQAQQAFHHRAKLNGAACHGTYSEQMEQGAVGV